jgi:PAS domain S-box-containing protein
MADRTVDDLRRSEQRFQAVIESAPVAILEVDLDARVIGWNPAAERIFGWTREEMLGRDDLPMVQASKRDESLDLADRVQTGQAYTAHETVRLRKDGALIDVAMAAAPVRNASGRIVSHMVVYSDISERKRQEASLAETQQLAHIGSWEVEVASERVTWSDELFRLWGLEPRSGGLSYESFLASIHPEDRPLVEQTVRRAHEDHLPFVMEHRVPLPDGKVRWIVSRGRMVTDDSGTPIRMQGTAQDITHRKLYEAELQRLNAELHERLEDLAASRARIVTAGDAARRLLERNLHDGAQQRLVALSISLRLVLDRLDADPGAARGLLSAALDDLTVALEELRELARGLHPAVLTEYGLGPAVESLATSVPVPVEIVETPPERLAEPIEAAAYYVISEALTNVAKYAQATTARVCVAQAGEDVVVEVSDDGVGGADTALGSGLRGLADRVEALGGRFELVSPGGRGTTVHAELPAETATEQIVLRRA